MGRSASASAVGVARPHHEAALAVLHHLAASAAVADDQRHAAAERLDRAEREPLLDHRGLHEDQRAPQSLGELVGQQGTHQVDAVAERAAPTFELGAERERSRRSATGLALHALAERGQVRARQALDLVLVSQTEPGEGRGLGDPERPADHELQLGPVGGDPSERVDQDVRALVGGHAPDGDDRGGRGPVVRRPEARGIEAVVRDVHTTTEGGRAFLDAPPYVLAARDRAVGAAHVGRERVAVGQHGDPRLAPVDDLRGRERAAEDRDPLRVLEHQHHIAPRRGQVGCGVRRVSAVERRELHACAVIAAGERGRPGQRVEPAAVDGVVDRDVLGAGHLALARARRAADQRELIAADERPRDLVDDVADAPQAALGGHTGPRHGQDADARLVHGSAGAQTGTSSGCSPRAARSPRISST